jgi:hypothetical protein
MTVATTTARTWRMAPADPALDSGAPRPADISLRGLCLLQIEFLTRYAASECIVTSAALPFLDAVVDMFPRTLFHVFCSQLEDPPRPNVIRHGSPFDKGTASAWRDRGGAPFNVIFTGEGMTNQMALHVLAAPAAALHMITSPPEHYLEGELVYPPYCPRESCLSAMVPDSGSARAQQYSPHRYLDALGSFHGNYRATPEQAGAGYDRWVEDSVLWGYAMTLVSEEPSAGLMVTVLRAGLPSSESLVRFSGV